MCGGSCEGAQVLPRKFVVEVHAWRGSKAQPAQAPWRGLAPCKGGEYMWQCSVSARCVTPSLLLVWLLLFVLRVLLGRDRSSCIRALIVGALAIPCRSPTHERAE